MAIKTNTKYNFTAAENEAFSWSTWDGTSGDTLKHKQSGRSIYQMHWLDGKGKMAEPVEGEIRAAASAFWSDLAKLQSQKPPRQAEEEEKHSFGWCDKCGSYCYGDCTA